MSTNQEQTLDEKFPCSLLISIPFPTWRLASTALRALRVDEELSPLVHRSFSLGSPDQPSPSTANGHSVTLTTDDAIDDTLPVEAGEDPVDADRAKTVLLTQYRATTNRMLRVSVNGFFESLAVVVQCMEELDVDVLAAERAG